MPHTRKEAVDEIRRSGFTISAMIAVSFAFPLAGEVMQTAETHARIDLGYYFEESCSYLTAWDKNTCQWPRQHTRLRIPMPVTVS